MKVIKIILLLTFLLSTESFLIAQACGTIPETIIENKNQGNFKSNYLNPDEPICFNVFFHIVRKSDGSGGYNASLLGQVTNKLNQAFNPFSLYVNNLGFDYIDDSTYYNIDDNNGNNSEFNSLVTINNKLNAINIYIVNDAIGYIGKANGILSQALVIESSSAETHILSHEVGHCLNLWHTFQGTASGTSGCAEAIDGANCSTCGDYVCDTPADSNEGHKNGYNPDILNIMSYYPNFKHFTQGQINRTREAFASFTVLQNILSDQCPPILYGKLESICYPELRTYKISFLQNNTTTWQTSSNVSIVSQSNSGISIKAINASVNGEGWVKATLSNGTVLKEDFWVGRPSTQKISIIKAGSIRLSEHSWNIIHVLYDNLYTNSLISDWEWRTFSSPGVSILSRHAPGSMVLIKPTSNNGYVDFQTRVCNECGFSGWKSRLFQIENSNSGGNGIPTSPSQELEW